MCNSGTEAVEAALKFARCATGRPRVLYCDHAFHGLTAGSLSVNGAKEFREGFGPLLPGTQVPFGDLDALRRELAAGDVAALIIEPVQGKGVQVVPAGLPGRGGRALLHRHGALLICDEVQSGLGRTGQLLQLRARRGRSPTWSRWPRPCRAGSSRSGPPSARRRSSSRCTRRWTGCSSTTRTYGTTPWPWPPDWPPCR